MSIKLYAKVKYVGDGLDQAGLAMGDVGYVIEDYEDGNYEVEFSNPDGSTRVQTVIAEDKLSAVDG